MKTTIDLPEPFYQSASELAKSAGTPVSRWIEALLMRILSERTSVSPKDEDFLEWRKELL